MSDKRKETTESADSRGRAPDFDKLARWAAEAAGPRASEFSAGQWAARFVGMAEALDYLERSIESAFGRERDLERDAAADWLTEDSDRLLEESRRGRKTHDKLETRACSNALRIAAGAIERNEHRKPLPRPPDPNGIKLERKPGAIEPAKLEPTKLDRINEGGHFGAEPQQRIRTAHASVDKDGRITAHPDPQPVLYATPKTCAHPIHAWVNETDGLDGVIRCDMCGARKARGKDWGPDGSEA